MVQWNLRYLQLLPLCAYPDLVHAFTTRRGGISVPPFSSLNLSFDVGDRPASVQENRYRLLSDIGIGDKPLCRMRQVHGDGILTISEEQVVAPDFPHRLAHCAGDALITEVPGVALTVSIADCVPILLFDRRNKAIAAIHGGWRSTASQLAFKVVTKMQEVFGTRPADCVAAIGPSIGMCCYEVDEPVIAAFSRLSPRWREWLEETGGGRWRLDLPKANESLLLESGIPRERVFSAGYCVSCRSDLFFSHRRDKGGTGRMMGLIMVRREDG